MLVKSRPNVAIERAYETLAFPLPTHAFEQKSMRGVRSLRDCCRCPRAECRAHVATQPDVRNGIAYARISWSTSPCTFVNRRRMPLW
jgi:hypothetical protein